MRIRIYQINPEKDASRSMFRSYDENRAVKTIWYNGRDGSNSHYDSSRYHGLKRS